MKKSHSKGRSGKYSPDSKGRKKSTSGHSVDQFPMRLNKYLAHGGIASRRKCAELVKAGHVTVNGEIEKNPAVLIKLSDKVSYKGQRVRVEGRKVYILLNKPRRG
jgi:23S rRNA pseudouridine2605 synthase